MSRWISINIDERASKPLRIKIQEPAENSKGILLHFHGFPGGPVEENGLGDIFTYHGYTFVSYNYPGLWNSPGIFSIENLFLSTIKVVDHITASMKTMNNKFFLFCESFGASVGIHLIKQRPKLIDKIVLRSPLLDFTPIIQFLPLTFKQLENVGILRIRQDFDFDLLETYNPRLIIEEEVLSFPSTWGVIGVNDDVLPGKDMFNASKLNSQIDLEIWENFPHNNISEELWIKFLNKMLSFLGDRN